MRTTTMIRRPGKTSGKQIILGVLAAVLPLSTVTAAMEVPASVVPSSATTQSAAANAPATDATGPASTQAAIPSQKGEAAPSKAPAMDPANDLDSMGLEDLMHVKVNSASKVDQNISQVAAAVTVINQDDIHRSGLTSIPELLRLAPGLDIARFGASQWAIGSRGFNGSDSNKLLVIMDGRTVYDPLYAGVSWSMQTYVMADLDKVEVIRGPGATLWGANAVNGVINITTKSARDTQGMRLDINGGTFDSNASIRYGGKIGGDTYYRVFGQFNNSMELTDHPTSNAIGNWEGSNGGFRIDKYPDADTTLTLEANVTYSLASPTPAFGSPAQSVETRRDTSAGSNLLARWTHNDSPESGMSLQIYYDHAGTDTQQQYNYHRDTVDLDFQHHFLIGDSQTLTWGFGLRGQQEVSDTSSPLFIKDGTRDDYIASTFAQDDLTLVPKRFHLILGSKFEYSSYDQLQVQPSLRLLFTPSKYHTFWVAASRAVRSPAILELAGHNDLASFEVQGNPNLKPEIVKTYEFGYRAQPTTNLTLDLSTFYNQYNQLIALDSSTLQQTGALSLDNGGRGASYGAELAANYKICPSWRLAASYTLLISHLSVAPGSIQSPGNDASTSPKNQFQVHSYYDISRNLEMNVNGYYVGSIAGVNSYPRLDVGLNWRPSKGFELGVTGQNLLQMRHTEFFQQGITSGGEIPRSLFIHFSYSF